MQTGDTLTRGTQQPVTTQGMVVDLSTGLREILQYISRDGPFRAFSVLKANTCAFKIKNLLRQNVKGHAITVSI